MRGFKLFAVLLSVTFLTGLMLMLGAPAEAGGKGNQIENKFKMEVNPLFSHVTGRSGSGKLAFNTKKGEFNLTVQAEGLVPGVTYHVSQTVRVGTDGNTVPAATLLDVAVVADSNGEIKVTRKHVALDLLNVAPGGIGTNWRIDQQVRGPDGGGTSGITCFDCVLTCSPTTKVHMNADGKLVEGWAS